jgi:hypothetical protein
MWGKPICKQPKQRNLNCDADDDEHERVFAKLAKERPQQQQLFAISLCEGFDARVRGSCLLGSLTLISDALSAPLLGWHFICKRGSSCHLIAAVIRWRFYFLIRTRQREKKREK